MDVDQNFDDFTIITKKCEKFNVYKMQSRIDDQRMSVIKKIENLPIVQRFNKKTLLKMVINYKIVDIVKIMKSTDSILTLHGKINLNRKEFFEISESNDAVIKVKLDGDFQFCDMIAYSRRNKNEVKKGLGIFRSHAFDLDNDYTSERLVMFREKNVVIIKMLVGAKTLRHMVEEDPSRVAEMYRESLKLFWNLRYLDPWIWVEKVDPSKKIIFYKSKWQLLSSPPEDFTCNKKFYNGENLSMLIKLFQSNGVSDGELKNTFKNIFETPVETFNYELYRFIMEKHFKDPENKKFSRVYYRRSHQNSTGRRMRSKK